MGDRLSAPSGEPGQPGRDPCQAAPGAGDPARGGGDNATAVPSDSRANGRGGDARVSIHGKPIVPMRPLLVPAPLVHTSYRFEWPTPIRVQRSRKKGSRLPPNTVVVSRPSKYENPFAVPDGLMPAARLVATLEAISKFKEHARRAFTLDEIRTDLGGKNLACWCDLDDVCHADVLLKLANP